MATTSFYTEEELQAIGFRSIGSDVKISRKASIYSAGTISIGSHVRIDDFCIISGDITIGSYIHISAYTALYGRFGIVLEDYVTISGRVLVYSQSDDYSGRHLTNPMVDASLTHITGAQVTFRQHAIVAAGCTILPGVTLHEGSCLGAMSLLKSDLPAWKIYAGVPAKEIGDRSKELLKMLS